MRNPGTDFLPLRSVFHHRAAPENTQESHGGRAGGNCRRRVLLTVALIAYSVATGFVSFAYRFYLPAMCGLVIALWAAVREQPALPKAVPQPGNFRDLMLKDTGKENVLDASVRYYSAV